MWALDTTPSSPPPQDAKHYLPTKLKGVKVSTPFINAFQKKKAWNLPKSFTNLGNFKTCFFSPQNVLISKLFFFTLLEMWRFSFFVENFPKHSLHHVCFHGGLFNGFSPQKINKIKIKLAALHLCVCLSRFKKTLKKAKDFTVSEGHGYPLVLYILKDVGMSNE